MNNEYWLESEKYLCININNSQTISVTIAESTHNREEGIKNRNVEQIIYFRTLEHSNHHEQLILKHIQRDLKCSLSYPGFRDDCLYEYQMLQSRCAVYITYKSFQSLNKSDK